MPALRALLLTSFVHAIVLLGSADSASAQLAPLPSNPAGWTNEFPSDTQIARGLTTGVWAADACRVEAGALHCQCLRGEGLAVADWTSPQLGGVALVPKSGDSVDLVTATSALWLDGIWILNDVVVLFPDAVLHAEEAHVTPTSTQLSVVTWHDRTSAARPECGVVIERGARRASARAASLDDGRWQVEGYRVGPWPLPLARSAHRSAPGILPPTVRAHADALQFEGAVVLFGPMFGFVAGGIAAPASAGVGVVTHRAERAMALRAIVATDDDGVAPMVVGDVAVGGSAHLRGHVEHPSSQRSWDLHRAENGAFFRDWRATHVGFGAAGGAHALQLSGAVLTDLDLPDPQFGGLLAYGTSFDSGRFAQWAVDLEHDSTRREDTQHSTTIGLSFRSPLGRRERAWVEPGVDLLANYGAVTVSRGFDASTTLSALAQVEAGLAVEGRFDDARHRLAPVLRLGAELGGVQQRQAREGAPPYQFERPDRWRWATLWLEQTFRLGPITLDLPVGVYADALADEAVGAALDAPNVFGRASTTLASARVDLAVVCADLCAEAGALLGAQLQPRPGMWIVYSVSDLTERDVALLFADRLTQRAFTAVRLIDRDATVTGFSHFASVAAHFGRLSAGIDGRAGVDAASRGFGARVGWHWRAIGWGLGASANWAPATGAWAALAGLSIAP